jgi:hypothetical protein
MLDPFTHVPEVARAEYRASYRQYLAERDGVLDPDRRQLSKREDRMRQLEGVAASRSLDRSLFDAQYAAFDPRRTTSPEMLLLLALVKVNAAEAYGVNATFDQTLARTARGQEDDTELTLLIEETYHTRILLSATRIYGFRVDQPYAPPLGLRSVIGVMSSAPAFLSRPIVFVSEVLGTIWFTRLFHLVERVLAHDPELRDAIQERLIEVLVDEIGHVTFNRLCLGPRGMLAARAMLPLVARGMGGIIPELEPLGLGPSYDVGILATLPAEVQRAAFVV